MRKERIIISGHLNEIALSAYIVENEQEYAKGLTIFDKIGWFECMVFELNPAKTHIFHTNNMKFEIDMIKLNENQEIIDILHNVAKDIKAIPIHNCSYLIEVKGGFCNKFGIEVGDKVFYDDVEYRGVINKHSFHEMLKNAEFEGVDAESIDYGDHLVYYDKLLKDIKAYNEARRKSIIDSLFRSHELFDIHSDEPEPPAMN